MTDAEIIKALECCADEHIHSCDYCPFETECYADNFSLAKPSLDLVKRYKTKNEQLDETIQKLDVLLRTNDKDYRKLLAENKELEAEIKRRKNNLFCKVVIDEETMRNIINEKVAEFELDIKSIKAEAIKEFAKRLKMANTSKLTWFNEDFDNLVKEMVGDAD